MKYNTFWGYFFWTMLLVSALLDLRTPGFYIWNLVYNGSLMGVNFFLWIITNGFILFLFLLKVSLLRWFFPLNKHRSYDLFGTREVCGLCAGISTLYAVIILAVVIFIGGLKTFDGIRLLQTSSIILTPFIFIYYASREDER